MRNANRARAEQPDEEELMEELLPPYTVFTREVIRHHHDVRLARGIGHPGEYVELCQLLQAAEEGDSVNLFLSTPGGDCSAAVSIIQGIRSTKAKVTTILSPDASSMGALLFLAGHERVAPAGSLVMFHNYSGSPSGKGHEQIAMVTASQGWYRDILEDLACGFLSPREIRAIIKGDDLYLRRPEILRRLELQDALRSQA